MNLSSKMADKNPATDTRELEKVLKVPSDITSLFDYLGITKHPSAREVLAWLGPDLRPIVNDESIGFIWTRDQERIILKISKQNEKPTLHLEVTAPSGIDSDSTWDKILDVKETIKQINYDKAENELLIQGEERLFKISPDGQVGTVWESKED